MAVKGVAVAHPVIHHTCPLLLSGYFHRQDCIFLFCPISGKPSIGFPCSNSGPLPMDCVAEKHHSHLTTIYPPQLHPEQVEVEAVHQEQVAQWVAEVAVAAHLFFQWVPSAVPVVLAARPFE